MPSNTVLRRQRAMGGALGVLVLAFALTYHFFPRLFHVTPEQTTPRGMSLGGPTRGSSNASRYRRSPRSMPARR